MKYSNLLMISMLCILSNNVYGEYIKPVKENNCTDCINLVNSIIFEEKKFNASVVAIIDIIKSICSHVYGPSAKLCTYVLNNIDNILKLIGEGMDAEKICKYLKMCINYLNI